jgi:nitroreductase
LPDAAPGLPADAATHRLAGMDAIAALTTRASPLKLMDPAPAGAVLEAMLGAGLRAPDHGRLRPWKFLLVRGQAREKLGHILANSLKAREPGMAEDALARERDKALRAPLIVVVAATVRPTAKVPDVEQVVSAGAAAQNILVAAHALGFGGFWRTGPPAYDPEVKRALGLGPKDAIVALLYIGTVAAPAPPRNPDPAGVVVEWS